MQQESAMSEANRPDPAAEGRLAASSGGVTTSNPYPIDTEEHARWLEGYNDAVDAADDAVESDFA